jgi:hypothetical protein
LELYLSISNLKWDYDAPEGRAGTIYLPDDLQPFSFDASKPQFDVVNEIWALLGQ